MNDDQFNPTDPNQTIPAQTADQNMNQNPTMPEVKQNPDMASMSPSINPTEPAATEPGVTAPVEPTPVETTPAPAQSKPVQTQPDNSPSVEPSQTEEQPV